MINRTVLVGRLTADVDLKYTQSGVAVASFTLAVGRQFTNQSGERESDYIRCVMWRKSAENFAKFVSKGSLTAIEGRLQTRNYDNNQGQRVYVTEVVADGFSLLESKEVSEKRKNSSSAQGNAQQGNNSYGGSTGYGSVQASDPFMPSYASGGVNITDDDIPF